MKRVILFSVFVLTALQGMSAPFEYRYTRHPVRYVYHKHNEASFQHAYCSLHGGTEEYKLPDKTRVDCLTDEYAIEFDFANKAYESVGQALHYGLMTGKKPKIVLILDSEKKDKQMIYFNRIQNIGKNCGIDVEYATDEILDIDEKGNCQFSDCKCRKKHIFSMFWK